MKDIVIIGAGGFGREVAWLIEDINKVKPEWNIKGFVDEDTNLRGKVINGYEVLGDVEWLSNQDIFAICAVGDSVAKKHIVYKLEGTRIKYPVLIHPSAILSDSVKVEEGSIICAGNILTVNIRIGKHVILNLDCTVGHDVELKNYTTVLPSVNISGNVVIEEAVSLGTGSAIIQGIRINENTIVGAGSVVVRDLPANCTAVGVPAKPIKLTE